MKAASAHESAPPTTSGNPKPKSTRGGKRPGAGRKRKGATSPTALSEIDLKAALAQEASDDLEVLTAGNAKTCIDSLKRVIVGSESDAPRVAACCRILDRAFGKPSVDVGGTLELFGRAPAKKAGFDARDYARGFAALAVLVLQKIRDNSPSAAARVAATTALMDRELGTVAVAKVPDLHVRPGGKKEQVGKAAEDAATGLYQTPAAPRQHEAAAQLQ